jgi:hypothetical protein
MHTIKVGGSVDRSFLFPGKLPTAYAYYADVGRLLSYLPRICLVRAYGPDRFRLLYSSTELGIYHIHIFADVQTTLEEGRVLHIRPLNGVPPVRAWADVHSSTSQGYFESRSVFHDEGERTRIDYHLQLQADLPAPTALRFVPGAMLAGIAKGITHKRIHEISEGFIGRSTDAFPYWLAEIENNRPGHPESR